VRVRARAGPGWGSNGCSSKYAASICPSARVLEHFEDVDVVVNNAGACMTGTFSATAVEDFRAQMDVVNTDRKLRDP